MNVCRIGSSGTKNEEEPGFNRIVTNYFRKLSTSRINMPVYITPKFPV